MSDASGPIAALRTSHDRLAAHVAPCGREELTARAYPSEWSLADTLSHLGSGAEIFELVLDAGLAGRPGPDRAANQPIWDRWNAKDPVDQARDSIVVNERVLTKLEALTATQRAEARYHWFLGELDTDTLVRLRLSEHAVHSWDVIVALQPSAVLGAESVGFLLDGLGRVAGWSGKGIGRDLAVRVVTLDPDRTLRLSVTDTVVLAAEDGAASEDPPAAGSLTLPAEALVRLVYGRLDPAHTPLLTATGVALDELRRVFPGF